VLGLKDIGCEKELPENQDTIQGNSEEKAAFVFEHYGVPCFADDTGLEVAALGGAPGVYSAMYAGPQRSDEDNIALLLKGLFNKKDRRARFRTVITLIADGVKEQFEGVVTGEILTEQRGQRGFGYDPVFLPSGHELAFSEMSMAEKNKISHRGLATRKLTEYLLEKL